MRFWAIIDHDRPTPDDPYSVFRAEAVRPPFELFDPTSNTWAEEVSLGGYFLGDEFGAVEIDADAAAKVVERKLAEVDAE